MKVLWGNINGNGDGAVARRVAACGLLYVVVVGGGGGVVRPKLIKCLQ